MRTFTLQDRLLASADNALKTLCGPIVGTGRPSPDADIAESLLSQEEKRHSAGLMRINHCGEICAQALYQGQMLWAHRPQTYEALYQAQKEENDHLIWCAQRLEALQSHTSYLNPLWYTGSWAIGALAAYAGDPLSLGFLEATEQQVEAHLVDHQAQLSSCDPKSYAILEQMRLDEIAHAQKARDLGAQPLPPLLQKVMRLVSRCMTGLTYYL